MNRTRFPLAYKVVLALLVVLLPILAVFAASYRSSRDNMEKLILGDLRALADDREGDVLLFIEMNRRQVRDFSSDGFVSESLLRIKSGKGEGRRLSEYLFHNKLPQAKNLHKLSVVSTDGRVVASTAFTDMGLDASKQEYFRKTADGVSVFGDEKGSMDLPELVITAPILNARTKKAEGIIAGYILVSEFRKIFTGEHSKELGALTWDITRGRRTMEVYLVNRRKITLTGSKFPFDHPPGQVVDTLPVRACLEEGREVQGFYNDYRGIEVAGASMCFPSMGWTLVVEIDRDEVLKPVSAVWKHTLVAVALTVVLIGFLFVFFFGVVISQIRRLAGAAREIAGGDYDISIPVESRDEIGELSESFNHMAREIRVQRKALKDSEERLRSILDNTINIVYMKDMEGRYILMNTRCERIMGMRMDEAAGKTDYDIFPREAAERLMENDRKAISSGSPLVFEETLPDVPAPHTYLSIKFPIRDSSGAVYAVCGVSTDITEMKRAEEALRRSEASLANAQRIAHIGNWDYDLEKRDIRWSDEMYRIFGMGRRGAGPSYEAFLEAVHPEDREYVRNMANYMGSRYSIDYRIVLPDGSEKIVNEQGEIFFNEKGRQARMSGTVQDITGRKLAEEEFQRLNAELERRVVERTAQLEAANRELESFSYSVAHDLRGPLRIIDGFSQALIEDYGDRLEEEGKDYLARLRGASVRMANLIDDLLELSRVIRVDMRHEEVDLSAMARAVADELKKSAPPRGARFVIEEGLVAWGDARLLRVALDNLLGNAWKFTSRHESAVIEFGARAEGGEKNVYFVRDDGAGFDMKYADRLFGAFHRLHSADDFPGTGVGLATVQRIIKRHGGRIWAEGAVGKGAVFYFVLG